MKSETTKTLEDDIDVELTGTVSENDICIRRQRQQKQIGPNQSEKLLYSK